MQVFKGICLAAETTADPGQLERNHGQQSAQNRNRALRIETEPWAQESRPKICEKDMREAKPP